MIPLTLFLLLIVLFLSHEVQLIVGALVTPPPHSVASSSSPSDYHNYRSYKSSRNNNNNNKPLTRRRGSSLFALFEKSNKNDFHCNIISTRNGKNTSTSTRVTGSFYHDNTRLLLTQRGGGGDDSGDTNIMDNVDSNDKKIQPENIKKLITYSIPITILLATILTSNKQTISSFKSFNFKQELANQLNTLSSMGTQGLLTYILTFMIWEIVVGVTTPIETAAGMAFGFQNGIIANAIGKTSGAILAFLLGRFVLKDYVTNKLQHNEYMDLVEDSITKHPIRVALIWRFSFLPEQIKNFGLAILPVKTWHFVTVVLLHGFPFTLLWTFMGNEMGSVVKGVVAEPSKILKILIGFVYVLGFFISPSIVGLWIKGLRDEKMKKIKKK